MEQSEFNDRRQKFLAQLAPNSVAIVATAREHLRTHECEYPFRADNDFYYLTGFAEPQAIAVFIPGRDEGEYVLFNRVNDPLLEIWHGYRAGQAGACTEFGADQAFSFESFTEKLSDLIADKEIVYYALGADCGLDDRVKEALDSCRKQARRGITTPETFTDVRRIIHEMRRVKSPAEVAALRKTCAISAAAHCRAMKACQPGMNEYQIEAEILYAFAKNGARFPGYTSIVAGGDNACILHYNDNNAALKDGDLLLIDAGSEYDYFSGDITRTFPVNGRFTPEQRAIYELVLRVNKACIAALKPGNAFNESQVLAVRLLTEGLVELGLLNGDVDQLIADKAYFDFYMHGVSHWLGMDTHDNAPYRENGEWRKLAPNMALTIEPGIYISKDNQNVDPKWRGIGIRIEDDILMTEDGCEVMTSGVPKEIDEIEALMAG